MRSTSNPICFRMPQSGRRHNSRASQVFLIDGGNGNVVVGSRCNLWRRVICCTQIRFCGHIMMGSTCLPSEPLLRKVGGVDSDDLVASWEYGRGGTVEAETALSTPFFWDLKSFRNIVGWGGGNEGYDNLAMVFMPCSHSATPRSCVLQGCPAVPGPTVS